MQKRVVEPQADEARTETDKVAVETRLTAEQFYTKADRDEPWNETLSYTLSGRERNDVFLFAEKFRDESERPVPRPITKCGLCGSQDICEHDRLIAEQVTSLLADEQGWIRGYERDQAELTELRAKLAEHERQVKCVAQAYCERLNEWRDKAQAAEAEAAALRERERWIPVEEKLPVFRIPVQVAGGVAELRIDGWWTYMESPKRRIEWKVTHWKALSAAPERGKGEQ